MSDQTRRRRDRKNLGGEVGIDRRVPALAAARSNVINIERLLINLLRSEVERLKDDDDLLDLYFGHLFDSLVGEEEREQFIENFKRQPPEVVLGYPRTSTTFPCFAIILQEDSETETFLGDHVGETDLVGNDTDDAEAPADYLEYVGALFKSTYGIFIYAQHPDVCLYLYYLAKMIVFGAKPLFLANGMVDVNVTGGEVAPDEQYLPNNMFIRTLSVTGESMFTVPQFALADKRRLRVLGLYREDVVVDGVAGGISGERFDGDETGDEDDGDT